MALPLNAVIGGKYRIERRVGAGGMGEVYRAMNLQTNRPVAVKALTIEESETALARFRQEAVIQYNLRHPNVAELFEYFEYQGKPCIVMEFVEGRTLDEWLRETGALEADKALEILADICDAVSFMHSKGTIHRDIKSENIRITAQGKAKLLDFGISISKTSPALTRIGYAIGTPEKMAPEQHQGLRGDARSDVWALGVLLYEMVTGVAPFGHSSANGLRQDILAVRYVPVTKRKPGVPKPIVRLISSCLRSKPEERYASSGVMLREVQQVRRQLAGRPWDRIPDIKPPVIAGGLAAVAATLIIYALVISGEPKNYAHPFIEPRPTERPSSGRIDPPFSPVDPAIPQPRRKASGGNNGGRSSPIPFAGTETSVRPDASADQRTVRIATYDGPADVTLSDGRVLGSTPYPLTGPLGSNHELWLRRQGYQPRRVDVQINATKNEYLFGLEKNETRSDFGKKD